MTFGDVPSSPLPIGIKLIWFGIKAGIAPRASLLAYFGSNVINEPKVTLCIFQIERILYP
jgi:hypothetical protein